MLLLGPQQLPLTELITIKYRCVFTVSLYIHL